MAKVNAVIGNIFSVELEEGASKVIVEGARRTTGANPGRLPVRLVFDIK